jgi:hypothetical protein
MINLRKDSTYRDIANGRNAGSNKIHASGDPVIE